MSSDANPALNPSISAVAAYDFDAQGRARPAADTHPRPADGASWRWLHFDLNSSGFADWAARNLPAIAARALSMTETRPRVDVDHQSHGLVLALRGINLNEGARVEDMVALRVWVTQDLVVTVRRRRVFAVQDTMAALDAGELIAGSAQFLAVLCDRLVGRIEDVSMELEEDVDALETSVYDDGGEAVEGLPEKRRRVIKLRRHVGPMTDALIRLAGINSPLISDDLRQQFQNIANSATRSVEELAEVRERLTALSDHLDLTQATRLGRNGYVLSVIASIFLPMSFLAGLFGVNLGGIPGAGSQAAFWLFSLALVVLGLVLFAILRVRRWL